LGVCQYSTVSAKNYLGFARIHATQKAIRVILNVRGNVNLMLESALEYRLTP
jgi:hypothetical protein